VAPFPLLSYQDAARRARLLAKVTERRVMPPWKAQPGHGEFANERRLTGEEIARIGAWASTGAQEGDPKDKPPLPRFPDGWQAGTPDQVLTIGGSSTVPADGPDLYRCFVVPTMLERDRYLAGAEFRPGNRLVVHHAIVFLDTTGRARKLAAGSADSSYACFGGPGFPPTGVIGGWAPGATPPPPIPGASRTLPAGADLVVQLHYHPSGKPETDVSRLGLTFSGPPTRGVSGIIVGNRRIDIPPGDAHYVVTGAITVPRDVDVVGIAPHAHYLCKDMKVDARLPDGSVRPLIWIADWDFDWQGQYVYQTPIHLPAGTRIELTYTYDNSDANPRNPSSPPVRVRRGEQTTDEMALAFLKVVLPSPQDVPAFERAMKLEYLKALFSQFSVRAGE
jgi:hypothetical protein